MSWQQQSKSKVWQAGKQGANISIVTEGYCYGLNLPNLSVFVDGVLHVLQWSISQIPEVIQECIDILVNSQGRSDWSGI